MVQLAQYYDSRNPRGLIVSEKFDGIRALWNGTDFLTRNGRIIDVPAYFKADMPSFEVDGELWCGHGNYGLAQGMTKGGTIHQGWDTGVFMAFDLPTVRASFADRLKELNQIKPTETMAIVKHTTITSARHLKDWYHHIIANGGEGLMLRNPDARYCRSRTTNLLKLKPSNDWAIYDIAA